MSRFLARKLLLSKNDVRIRVKRPSTVTQRSRCAGTWEWKNAHWTMNQSNSENDLSNIICLNSVFCLEFNMKELFVLLCLLIGHSLGIRETNVKSGRLFSNLFGILGHEACQTTLNDRNVTGICYNEMECLLKWVDFWHENCYLMQKTLLFTSQKSYLSFFPVI